MIQLAVVASAAILTAIDQMLKIWILENLAGQPSRLLIPGLLQLTYVENRGAAFGIFQGKTGLLSVLTGIVLLAVLIAVLMGKFKNRFLLCCISLILAGGVGNLIDRVSRGFVVDYLDISPLFSFPVFNFADCCVVVGTILLLIYLLFFEGRQNLQGTTQPDTDTEDTGGPENDGQ